MQKVPRAGEGFDFEGRRFTVEEMEGHRIARVRIDKGQPAVMQQAGD